ncbi:MAG: phosphoribosyltransferase family protein, partial [Cyanobacteriota bacterium]
DPHSEVCLALINNAEAISNYEFVEGVLKDKSNYLIASPDAGAYKKIFKLCQYLNYQEEILTCNKIRNVENGHIKSITVSVNDFHGKDIYIVDDICDGGGTFILLAQELKKRNCGKVNLIVSHGIFSHGEETLKQHVDTIYTTNSFKDIKSDYIEQTILKF